jgi:hypothetical protein
MLSPKKSAQTPVFIAFFSLITISTAKSGLKLSLPVVYPPMQVVRHEG